MALCGGADEHKRLLARVNRIEGQVRGLNKMIQEDRDCMDVLKQIAAASGALRSLGMVLMEHHLRGCVASAIMAENTEEEDHLIHQVVEVFNKFSK
jgi:DNA-binding FrmR family transcriptional regulator